MSLFSNEYNGGGQSFWLYQMSTFIGVARWLFVFSVGERVINHRPGLSVGKMLRFSWWICLYQRNVYNCCFNDCIISCILLIGSARIVFGANATDLSSRSVVSNWVKRLKRWLIFTAFFNWMCWDALWILVASWWVRHLLTKAIYEQWLMPESRLMMFISLSTNTARLHLCQVLYPRLSD